MPFSSPGERFCRIQHGPADIALSRLVTGAAPEKNDQEGIEQEGCGVGFKIAALKPFKLIICRQTDRIQAVEIGGTHANGGFIGQMDRDFQMGGGPVKHPGKNISGGKLGFKAVGTPGKQ